MARTARYITHSEFKFEILLKSMFCSLNCSKETLNSVNDASAIHALIYVNREAVGLSDLNTSSNFEQYVVFEHLFV